MKINTYVLSKSHASGKAGISRNISVNSMNISHFFRNFDPHLGKTVRIPSGARKIISKVCPPMGCVWVSKIFKMGASCDEL